MKTGHKLGVLGFVALVPALVMLAAVGPIAQDPHYHNFADRRTIFGVPNFFDVASNIGFLLVGIAGLWRLGRGDAEFIDARERGPWMVIFAGLALTGFGSGYYHLDPNNVTLVWDRLPMTLVTTPLLAALVAERINVRAGLWLLAPLLAAGMASVGYWAWTESHGRGDLRPYALAQYLPLLLVPWVLGMFKARYSRSAGLLAALGWYALAKLGEHYDAAIFTATGISGHTLKHLAAAAALLAVLRMLVARRPRVANFVRSPAG